MGQSRESIKIEKLTDDNCTFWKFKMEQYLTASELADFIGENAANLIAEGANNREENLKKDKKALALINLHISDHLISVVRSKVTAKLAWDALAARYQSAGLAKKLYLRRRFFTCQMRDGDSVMQHVDGLQQVIDELAGIGSQIAEEDKVLALLGSLPESYSSLITALESRTGDLTWEFVVARLLHEEHKLTSKPARL